MRLSTLVIVLFRVFAIYWLITATLGILGSFSTLADYGGLGGKNFLRFFSVLSVPGFYLTLAVISWVFAASLSRRVVGQTDPELGLSGAGIEHLYALVLLGFGIYFFLSHVGYAIYQTNEVVMRHRTGTSLIEHRDPVSSSLLLTHLIPCGIGIILALFSSRLGKKLATFQP